MESILIIDDEPDIRNMVKFFLEECGFETIQAENGAAGLVQFNKFLPRIVITDIRMPAMSGVEVLARIKKIRPETEVIVITGHGEMKLAVQALQNDASDFIQKPFGFEVLTIAVNRAMEKIKVREKLSQAQVQLLQVEKMAALGQLAAGIAHEVNNPIGFISSNLSSLKKYAENVKNALTELQNILQKNDHADILTEFKKIGKKHKLDFILADMDSIVDESLEGARRVANIVHDLRDFSHADTKKMVKFNLNDCIDSTLNIIRNEIKYKAVIEKKLDHIPLIVCFPQQINQVIMNLVMNSLQAIDKDGKIVITTRTEPSGVALIVEDNGSGIPQDIINKIFDPFFTTKDVGKGTGLGLHIVYNIIDRHGGKIQVSSEIGKGTVFQVFLPFAPPDYSESAAV